MSAASHLNCSYSGRGKVTHPCSLFSGGLWCTSVSSVWLKYFPSKQSKGRPLGVQDIFRSDSAFDERHGLLASSIHVASVLRSLHWLKIPQCIPYKNAAPNYNAIRPRNPLTFTSYSVIRYLIAHLS